MATCVEKKNPFQPLRVFQYHKINHKTNITEYKKGEDLL